MKPLEEKYLNLWSLSTTIFFAVLSGFSSFIGLILVLPPVQIEDTDFTPIFPDYLMLPILLTPFILASIVLERNKIALKLAKKIGLRILYDSTNWINNLSLLLVIVWMFMLPFGATIVGDAQTYMAYQIAWMRLTGVLFLLFILNLFVSDFLSSFGRIKIFFEEIYNKLDDFEKAKPCLGKGLKEVENYLKLREIDISHRKLLYKLSIKSIKNEDVSKILRELENSILQSSAKPSTYECLKGILEDEKEIKQLERFSLKRWFGQIPPYRLLYLILLAIALIITLLTQRIIFP